MFWHWANTLKDPTEAIRIGVQIEGRSFRLFLEIVGRSASRACAEKALISLYLNHGVFAAIPNKADLDGRRPVGEYPRASPQAMTAEVDDDVD